MKKPKLRQFRNVSAYLQAAERYREHCQARAVSLSVVAVSVSLAALLFFMFFPLD